MTVGDMGQQRQIGREAGGISRPGHRLDELSRKRDDIKLGLDFRNWG